MTSRFDDAVDRAVREMLDVEPPADLRARVLARLPAAGSRPPAAGFRLPAFSFRLPAPGFRLPAFGFRLPAFGFRHGVVWAAAAAAIVLLALVVARRGDPVAPAMTVATGRTDRHLPLDAPARVNPAATVPIRRTDRTAASARDGSASRVVVAIGAAGTNDIDPLKALPPIGMREIAQEHITASEIAIRPLNTITELQIAPLTPPDRR